VLLLSTSGIPASAARHAHRVDFAGGLAHRVTSARFVHRRQDPLVYELLVMNVSSSAMMLDRLETLDASKGDAGVNTKSGDAIVATLQGADLEATIRGFPTGNTRTVGPFQLTRIFLDVKFAKDATLPKVLP